MKNIVLISSVALLLLTFSTACNLTKEVEIDLPDYARQPVVECYLEPGKPYRLLLTRSYDFFAAFDTSFVDFLTNIQVPNASILISKDGQVVDSLRYNPFYFDSETSKLFNYVGTKTVPYEPGSQFTLSILLPNNEGDIRAEATMLPLVPIDSVVIEWDVNRDSLARVLTYFTSDLSELRYYRRMMHYSTDPDSAAQQDFLLNNQIFQTPKAVFGSAYELREGDTIINRFFHLEKSMYDFNESVQLAVIGNINPFAQPSPIKGNLTGTGNALGIFTTLVYDVDTTVVRK